MNEPKLRFKADDGSQFPEWEEKKLNEIAVRVTRKNKDNVTDIPLTISSADGLIDQRNFFNKVVASKDMSGYYLLKNGEFAYNKSYSKGYDFGSIKRLDLYDEGALSTLYICFALNKNENSDFYQKYFDSLSWYPELQKICAEGARNHGLLNVPTNDFFQLKLCVPSSDKEQQKIAEFLSTIDTVIEKQKETVSSWEERKKGVMQKLFNQEVRFKDDDGSEFPEWEEKHFSEMYKSIPNKQYQISTKEYKKCGKYKVIDQGKDFIAGYYDDKSKVYGSVPIIVYGDHTTVVKYLDEPFVIGADGTKLLDKISNNFDIKFLYFALNFNNVKQMGYKRHFSALKEISFTIPFSLAEQQKIADCLSTLDEVIEKQKATLAAWEKLKKGLLQQMFV
ncbi:restriction endonuclease subunit S [Mediterraneibacter faecis]|uniref:restriction endonuclease subunit S n=1 Tax=Mediterraneibacter faecis TaxID=592978 RepID=UPI001D01D0CC|nr:restriction endonuclease subunit S [Mediterraneibacter faecis]MCB5753800.1 restriction endonuclease subunit S [Mediterraneibacter faecis]